MGEHNINSMFLTPVVEHELISIVKLCKPKNSKDCDDISNTNLVCMLSLKLSSQLLSLLLTFLIYHSLVEFSQIT